MSTDMLAIKAQADLWIHELIDQGYCIIPDLIDRLVIAALQRDLAPYFAAAPFCEGFSTASERSALVHCFADRPTPKHWSCNLSFWRSLMQSLARPAIGSR